MLSGWELRQSWPCWTRMLSAAPVWQGCLMRRRTPQSCPHRSPMPGWLAAAKPTPSILSLGLKSLKVQLNCQPGCVNCIVSHMQPHNTPGFEIGSLANMQAASGGLGRRAD